MSEGLFDSSVWILLIPVALMALSGLFPAQHYIHIFQLESYKRPQFFMRVKEDTAYEANYNKYRLYVFYFSAFIFVLLLILSINVALFRNEFTTALDFFTPVSAVVFVSMLAKFLWKKHPTNSPLKSIARVARLNIMLAIVLFFAQCFICMFLLVLFYSLDTFFLAVGWFHHSKYNSILPILGVLFSFKRLNLLPGLLALASIMIQPVENLLEKRKRA